MSWAVVGGATIAAIGTNVAANKQANAAKDSANAISEAGDQSTALAQQARRDALELFGPAFGAIFDSTQQFRDELASGTQDTAGILQTATGQANQLLNQGSQAFQSAILGQPFNPVTIDNQTGQVSQQTPDEIQRNILQARQPREISPTTQPIRALRDGGQQEAFRGRSIPPNATIADLRDQGFSQEEATRLITQQQRVSPVNPLAGFTGEQPALPSAELSLPGQVQAPGLQAQDFSGIGLSGAENALNQALQGIGAATTGGINVLQQGGQQARGDITSGLNQGLQALTQGVNTGRGDVSSALNQALGFQQPFLEGGQTAFQRQLALSGALGQEAFDQATINNPAQQFIEDRQRQQLLRSAGATGGVGSGALLTALQEQGTGFAQQDLQRQIQNLQQLSGQGQQAAGISSNLAQGAGNQLANLAFGGGQSQLGARQRGADTLAQIAQVTAGNIANLGFQGAQAGSGLLQNIGQARLNVGQLIGGQQAGTAEQQAANQLGLGTNLGNLNQQTISALAQAAGQLGPQQAGLLTNLAGLLGNISGGQATNAINLAGPQANAALLQGQAGANQAQFLGNAGAQLIGFLNNRPQQQPVNTNQPSTINQQPTIGPF